MPGNEVADKVHNFFEQDSLYQEQHNSDVARAEFARSQFRNQELSLNGSIHGHQGFQARQNQVEFRGGDVGSNRLKVAPRGLSIGERQLGNAPEHSPSLGIGSEKSETTETPISFDFLGRPQQVMRSQQPGMPQQRQQSGHNDQLLWQQQQLMFKQLHELQRHKQLQQLDQNSRQHNLSQLPSIAKQATNDQMHALANGNPVHDASSYMWSNEHMGGDSKVPNNTQMFMVGNTNWAQRGGPSSLQGIPNGLILSNEQGQVLRAMGLIPQQPDQSLYGAPVASSRGAFNHYPHIQGLSQDSADLLPRASGSQLEKPLMQSSSMNRSFQGDQSALFADQISMQDGASVSKQVNQGRNFFGHPQFQGMNSGVQTGNYQQLNSVPRSAQMQEFHGGQQQPVWSGNLQEKAISQMAPSQGFVSLDPGEERILFSSDDNMWDAPGGKTGVIGAGGYGNSIESTEHLNLFPSVQSGTWSALMQSAVAEASSSDTGLQDEWSGLSFQKTELSTGNQTTILNESTKQQTDWTDNNLQNASSSTSRPFPLFDDAKMNSAGQNPPDFNQSGAKNSYEESERMQHNAPYDSMQQPSKESGRWLDHSSPQQMSLVEGTHHVQPSLHLENASQSAWSRRMYEQSENPAYAHMPPNVHNLQQQGSWINQQGMPSYNVDSQTCSRPASCNNNESSSPSGDPATKIHESENSRVGQKAVSNSFSTLAAGSGSHHFNREDSRMNSFTVTPNSSNTKGLAEASQQILNNHHHEYSKHMVDSSGKFKGGESVGNYHHLGSQVLESSTYNSNRDSYHSNQSQATATRSFSRDNAWLSASDSRSLATENQKSTAQVGRKVSGPRRFQFHPMGNLEVDMEPTDALKHAHPQALPQQAAQGPNSHGQEYAGYPKFMGHVPDNAIDMEKEHLSEDQANARGSTSFDGSPGFSSQGKRTVQTCQNMLELFHKVDQSREQTTPSHLGSSDHNPLSNLPEAESSDASVSHQWHNQSTSSQGFGLRLAPPSQRLPVTSHAFPFQNSSQIANDSNSRQVDHRLGEKNQMWLSPTSSVQSVPHEVSQRECWDNNPSISGQMGNETPQSNMQANSSTTFASTLPSSKNQMHSSHTSSAGLQVMKTQSVNTLNDRLGSHFGQSPDIHNGMVANQSAHAPLPRAASRTPPFNLSSPEDTSQPTNTTMRSIRVSGQQFPVLESVPVSQSSAIAGRSQQGAFSKISHNVWNNVSGQQHVPGGPSHKVPPNLFHSSNPSNINVERAPLAAQKLDHRETREGENDSEFDTCSISSQRVAYAEERPGKESHWQQMPTEKVDPTPQRTGESLGQESPMKHLLGTNPNSTGSLVAHSSQQEASRGRYGKDPVLVPQKDHLSTQNPATSSRDIEAYARSLKQAHASHPNYSLLHQVQTMKTLETDPNKRGGKRLKGADSGTDVQQAANKSGQQLFDGRTAIVRDSMDNELNAAVRRTCFSSGDGKMLSFSADGREEQNRNASSQAVLGDVPSQDRVAFAQCDSLGRSSHQNTTSDRSDRLHISRQMAPSWFEQYGTFKTGQMLPMYDARGTLKPVSQPFIFRKPSESLETHTPMEPANAAPVSQTGIVSQNTSTTVFASEHVSPSPSVPSEVSGHSLSVIRPKKRKTEPVLLLPWHKEITTGSQRLQSISMAEKDWAQAANRLIEKVEDESESLEDGQSLIRSRKRLIITTQLMQQLLHPAPASVLSAEANSHYESVIYFVAKLALGEACSLISCLRSDPLSSSLDGNTAGEIRNPQRLGDQFFSKVVEDFIGRGRKLENDLQRLEKRASMLDVRVECQELEKIYIINRFARYHGRGQADGAETSSSSSAVATTHRTLPKRYVTPRGMPRNLPEGVQCLSL